jgi:predicted O-methyltransferase YrrM
MLKKIFKIITRPHLIPKKIFDKILFTCKKLKYQKKKYENNQYKIFKKFKLNRNLGLKKLSKIKNLYKFLFRDMSSEHEVLFSSLSLSNKNNIKKILEIGTFDGKNSFLLSLLFKNSKIDTIDLRKNNINFKNSYNREKRVSSFVNLRNKILSKNKNINFKELNSIKLCNINNKYDLIWIDGAHGYPIVCIDIINSLRLISRNGIIICDDIYINKVKSDQMYNSNASFETLTELKKEKIINFQLIYKRLDENYNCDINTRKFIAIIKKYDY